MTKKLWEASLNKKKNSNLFTVLKIIFQKNLIKNLIVIIKKF